MFTRSADTTIRGYGYAHAEGRQWGDSRSRGTMRAAQVLVRLLRVSTPVAVFASLVATSAAAQAVTTYPSVTITSPAQHAPWTGLQAVYATVPTDPAGSDSPASSMMYVD